MSSLLLWSLGPVQDFIVMARKSRDLWFGSWLLSALSKRAARVVAEQQGLGALVLPGVRTLDELEPDSGLMVANKVLAVVKGDSAPLAAEMEHAARELLLELGERTFDAVLARAEDRWRGASRFLHLDAAREQLKELLEFYWVSVPLEGLDWSTARRAAESLLGARKSGRDFDQPLHAGPWPKSSLDGGRESVIDESFYDALRSERVESQAERLRLVLNVSRGERLSGVDLFKRFGHLGAGEEVSRNQLPSTSAFAWASTRLEIEDRRLQEDVLRGIKRYYGIVEDLLDEAELDPRPVLWDSPRPDPLLDRRNPALLYPSRLREYLPEDLRGEAELALGELYREWKRMRLSPPTPYYALIQADGDHMGALLDALHSPEDNRRLSAALAGFASKPPHPLERSGGQVVYAGGDDLLGFLPVRTALDVSRAVQETFTRQLATWSAREGHPRPTLSAGLVVVHHLHPLRDALLQVRAAERRAKDAGRDRLSVALLKRSGAPVVVTLPWEAPGDLPDVGFLYRLVDAQDEIPGGLAGDLQAAYRRLDPLGSPLDPRELAALHLAELRRILQRKEPEGPGRGGGKAYEELVEAMSRAVMAANRAALDAGESGPDAVPGLPLLADLLLLARGLAGMLSED